MSEKREGSPLVVPPGIMPVCEERGCEYRMLTPDDRRDVTYLLHYRPDKQPDRIAIPMSMIRDKLSNIWGDLVQPRIQDIHVEEKLTL
jgi:hypothetical protein